MSYLLDMQQTPSNSKTNIPLIIAASTSHGASLVERWVEFTHSVKPLKP
jgi:hypothetical protein